MNINLISPEDNGHNFVVRFKEDIVIPKDSKVYLNYATLTRRGNYEFTRDQQLYLVIPQNTEEAEQSDPSANVLPTRNGAITGANFNFNIPLYNTELAPPAVSNVGVATILAGVYDYGSMLFQIETALNSILSRADNGANLELYRAIGEGDLDENYDAGDTDHDVAFGIVKNNSLAGNPPLEDVSIKDNIDADTGLNLTLVNDELVKSSGNKNKNAPNDAVAVWDNYLVGSRRYNFLNNLDSTPLGQMGLCQFDANKTYQELGAGDDAICVGLFNKPYSVGIYGTNGTASLTQSVDDLNRVRGNTATNNQANGNNADTFFNPPQINYIAPNGTEGSVNARQPNLTIAPLQVCVDGRSGNTAIKIQCNRTSNTATFGLTAQVNAGQNINNFSQKVIKLASKNIDPTSDIRIGIVVFQTLIQARRTIAHYQRNSTDGYMGVAVLNMNEIDQDKSLSNQPKDAVIFKQDNFFNRDYFIDNRRAVGGGLNPPLVTYGATATGGANRVLSQTPFVPFISALKNGTGFTNVLYSPLTDGGDEATKPKTNILKYSMLATSDLAHQIGLQTKVDYDRNRLRGTITEEGSLEQIFYPNGTTTDPYGAWGVKKTKMALLWRRLGYSILLKNLPLQNYKNTEDTRDGGYSKNILSNIPAPFQNAEVEYNSKSKHLVTSSYEPNFKVNNNMNNQPFSTNKFEVEIVNNKTDKPATEILNSVINFTIEPPETKIMDNTIKNI
tara:strand:- start:5736 stop:7922 length:2187 start_codon:yes stop_codon:yes gene_type:complete